VKPESGGGLLLHRHVTPLSRRNVVYFCSGAHTLESFNQKDFTTIKSRTIKTESVDNTISADQILKNLDHASLRGFSDRRSSWLPATATKAEENTVSKRETQSQL
jgi:hypothetical protein